MSICDAGYTTGSGTQSCREYKNDIKYSKVYCDVDKALLKNETIPYRFTDAGTVEAPTDCIGLCLGDFITKTKRYRQKYVRAYDPRVKRACCLGELNDEINCDPAWCFESDSCDQELRDFCATAAGMKDPVCGCLLPASSYDDTHLLGAPECVDKRCAGNPRAYRTKRQRDMKCPDIVNCSIGNISIVGTGTNIDLGAIEQQCGKDVADELKKKIAAQNSKKQQASLTFKNPWIIGGSIVAGIALLGGLGYYVHKKNKL